MRCAVARALEARLVGMMARRCSPTRKRRGARAAEGGTALVVRGRALSSVEGGVSLLLVGEL